MDSVYTPQPFQQHIFELRAKPVVHEAVYDGVDARIAGNQTDDNRVKCLIVLTARNRHERVLVAE